VVHGHKGYVILFAQAKQTGPQKGALGQVEGTAGLFGSQPLGLQTPLRRRQAAQVHHRQRDIHMGSDDLLRLSIERVKRCAEDLVPPDDLAYASFQGPHIQAAG
jgi:hypothetical protein